MPHLAPLLRRPHGKAAAVAVLAVACYAAGVATASSSGPARHSATPTGAAKASIAPADLDAVRDRIEAQSLNAVSRSRLDEAAVEAMVGALSDPWSTYFSSSDFAGYEQSLDGHYTGVGLLLRERDDGSVAVAAVQPGSPAADAHVPAGAVVLAVDGHDAVGRSASDLAQELHGPAGTSVKVTLDTGGAAITRTMVRSSINSDDVVVTHVTPTVARIQIVAFTRGVGEEVADAVTMLRAEHIGGIVLDLRGNPGGLLDEAVTAASAFLDGGPVVSYERRGAKPVVLDATRGGDTRTPVAVLVDGGTASAAEVLAGALQDRGRAVLIGTRTFGKGTVQEPVRLADGSAIEMTVARYRVPSGRSIDGVGLQPDIEVSPGSPPSTAEHRASQVLAGLLADAGTGGRG